MQNPVIAIKNYLNSSIAELRKVTWPSRDLTVRYSALVIVVSLTLAAFFAALDFGFSNLVTAAFNLRPAVSAPVDTAATETPIVTPTTEPIEVKTTGEDGSAVNVTAEPLPAGQEGTVTLPPLNKK